MRFLRNSVTWMFLDFVPPKKCPGDGRWFVSLCLKNTVYAWLGAPLRTRLPVPSSQRRVTPGPWDKNVACSVPCQVHKGILVNTCQIDPRQRACLPKRPATRTLSFYEMTPTASACLPRASADGRRQGAFSRGLSEAACSRSPTSPRQGSAAQREACSARPPVRFAAGGKPSQGILL